jgi:prepilin-type N-terminal cleavage/methylation domain-containing protein
MIVQSPESRVQSPEKRDGALADSRDSSFVIRHFREAFTLIELLTVIAIVGILAALLAPVLKNFSKPDVTVAATRQLLDDVGRARQLAIANRSTVYMVFVPTNFWNDPFKIGPANQWNALQTVAPLITTSTVVTQLYSAQWNGYMIVSLRDIGDQPGKTFPKDLVRVKTLPAGSFIAPFKFTAPSYVSGTAVPYPTNRSELLIYGFLKTNTIPFPTSDVMTNTAFMVQYNRQNINFVTLPYIAFNYLGQLTSGDNSVLPYDENIPLAYGSIAEPVNTATKSPIQGLPNVIETPAGSSTNTTYNVIHIDRLTGRARLERQDLL